MKRTVTLLALLAALCCLLTFSAAAESTIVDSGTCGENLTWTLDGAGTLRIAGEGAMGEYENGSRAPWYKNCDSIKAVVIETGVTSIGSHAFDTCRNLTSVTFNGNSQLTTIGKDAFYQCSSLTSVTFAGESPLTTIGDEAFCQCSSLTEITLPESVTSIGERAFYQCSALTSLTFAGNSQLTTIGRSAFSECSSLAGSMTIPESVTSIGDLAFYCCRSLTGVTFAGDSQLTTIGGNAFCVCESLIDITIPRSVKVIGEGAFSSCFSLTDVSITDMDAWCRIDFGNYSATPMYCAQNIRLNGSKIASVTVPEGVTELNYTFYGFKDLIRVTLPKSLTGIGEKTFYKCTSLISITIPDGVTAIGDRACSGCTSLASVTIPASVATIGDGAFEDCSGLTSVTIPEGVATIGIGAFKECCNLVNVTIPDSVTAIGKYAFMYCGSLTSITLPEGLTAINDWVFSGCVRLTSVTIPEGVTSIGDSAFWNCSRLTSVTIPQSVTTIGGSAFVSCADLTDVYISDLDAWFQIEFADGFASPFYYAKNLYLNGQLVESLEIPGSVSVIQAGLFRSATCLKRVAIPRSLAGVAANAFEKCTNITEVFYEGSESEWANLPISSGNDPLKNAQVYFNSTLDDYYCRISVQVSSGGRVTVDHTTAKAGETVTVTAAPYQGYELAAVCVDGAAIQGNTFAVTGNHVVSAVFTRLPVTGGTEDFRLEGLSVRTAAGDPLQELPAESLLVTVAVKHLNETGSGTILLAQYDSQGRYRGLMWLTLDEMPQGMTLRVTLPVDNSSGEIANLKVFVVEDLTSPLPVGTPVSFGQV